VNKPQTCSESLSQSTVACSIISSSLAAGIDVMPRGYEVVPTQTEPHGEDGLPGSPA